jgi:hypothetical protein
MGFLPFGCNRYTGFIDIPDADAGILSSVSAVLKLKNPMNTP